MVLLHYFLSGISKFNAKSAGYCMGSASSSLQAYTAVLNSAYEANRTLAVINTVFLHAQHNLSPLSVWLIISSIILLVWFYLTIFSLFLAY